MTTSVCAGVLGSRCLRLVLLAGLLHGSTLAQSPSSDEDEDFQLETEVERAAEEPGRSGFELDPLRGLLFHSGEGALMLRLGGRIHLDGGFVDSDQTGEASDVFVRRLRPYLAGAVGEDWSFKVEYEFAIAEGWRNVRLRYSGFESVRLTGGNMIAPFGLESSSSSNTITFLARSLADSLAPGFRAGVDVDAGGDHWTAGGGVFTHPIDGEDRNGVKGTGVIGRATWSPVLRRKRLVHFGASGLYQRVQGTYRVSSRPESRIAERTILNTGTIADVNSTFNAGFEAAGVYGPFSLQGEAYWSHLERTSQDVEFFGWYVQGSAFLTGEHRRFGRRSATFGSVRPNSSWGALECAARVSGLDLEDEDITGGRALDATLGLNWYVRRNVRLMVNYVYGHASPNRNGLDEDVHVVQFRLMGFL